MSYKQAEEFDEFFADWFYGEGFPTYEVNWSQAGDSLSLLINQSTSHPSVEFYEMPIEIQIQGENQEITARLEHLFSGQEFQLQVPFTVNRVIFDPNYRIISGRNVVTSSEDYSDFRHQTQIYPNPGQDKVIVNWEEVDWKEIEILSLSGEVVWSSSDIEVPLEILTEDIPNGTYLILLRNSKYSLSKKLIIQK